MLHVNPDALAVGLTKDHVFCSAWEPDGAEIAYPRRYVLDPLALSPKFEAGDRCLRIPNSVLPRPMSPYWPSRESCSPSRAPHDLLDGPGLSDHRADGRTLPTSLRYRLDVLSRIWCSAIKVDAEALLPPPTRVAGLTCERSVAGVTSRARAHPEPSDEW